MLRRKASSSRIRIWLHAVRVTVNDILGVCYLYLIIWLTTWMDMTTEYVLGQIGIKVPF